VYRIEKCPSICGFVSVLERTISKSTKLNYITRILFVQESGTLESLKSVVEKNCTEGLCSEGLTVKGNSKLDKCHRDQDLDFILIILTRGLKLRLIQGPH
jgi:hypothetical protein